jgi:hypothetical protein
MPKPVAHLADDPATDRALLGTLKAAERAAAPDDSENGSEKGQTPCQP